MPELIREVVSSLAARVFFQLQRRCRGISALMRQPHVLAMVVSALPLECTAFVVKNANIAVPLRMVIAAVIGRNHLQNRKLNPRHHRRTYRCNI